MKPTNLFKIIHTFPVHQVIISCYISKKHRPLSSRCITCLEISKIRIPYCVSLKNFMIIPQCISYSMTLNRPVLYLIGVRIIHYCISLELVSSLTVCHCSQDHPLLYLIGVRIVPCCISLELTVHTSSLICLNFCRQ